MENQFNKATYFTSTYNRELSNINKEHTSQFKLPKLALWPDNNIYFREGLHHLLLCQSVNFTHQSYIYIDFSSYNTRYFTTKKWIQNLKPLVLKVIIICDRMTAPLAAFWLQEEPIIYAALFANEIFEKSGRIYDLRGNEFKNTKITRLKALTKKEFYFMSLIFDGNSIKSISITLNINLKKAYNTYQSICQKMAVNLKFLLRIHC
ncbi:RmbA [Klebsiella pneumoniae]|nr:RmbA [Klebsiella pneumoniae]